MPAKVISANLFVCEMVLNEGEVLSAIRMVDAFFLTVNPEIPVESQQVPMQVLLMVKIDQQEEVAEYELRLDLVRPNGETKTTWKQKATIPDNKQLPNFPIGLNLISRVNVLPRQMGTHYWHAFLDGTEVAKIPFTLLPPEQRPANPEQISEHQN